MVDKIVRFIVRTASSKFESSTIIKFSLMVMFIGAVSSLVILSVVPLAIACSYGITTVLMTEYLYAKDYENTRAEQLASESESDQ